MAETETSDILTLTTEIVASYASAQSHLKPEELPALIRSVRAALSEVGEPDPPATPEIPKATKSQINKSIQPNGLVSFVDGKTYKTLKRHLTRHGHTFDSYKATYGLPSTYPSVAPEYSEFRSALARSLGLGAGGRKARNPTLAKPPKKKSSSAS